MHNKLKFLSTFFSIIISINSFAFNFYEDKIEKLSYIPLDTGLPFKKYVLFTIYLKELKKDDVLLITSEFEVTNNTNINLMIASTIELCDSENSTNGIIVDPNNGFNINPQQHHGVTVKSRLFKINKDMTDKYMNVIIWTASSAATSQDYLKIEPNYGHLDVLIIN